MLTRIKNNSIVLFVVILQAAFYLYYIKISSANIVFQDQFDFLNYISKYFDGNLTFSDLWRSHMEHRTLGYNLIFLGNALFFHLNTLLEAYSGTLVLFATSLTLYAAYLKSMRDRAGNLFIQVSFIALSFIIFSLNQWENIVFSLGVAIMIKCLVFLLSMIILDRMLTDNLQGSQPLSRYLSLMIMLALSILVLGGGYSPALAVAMIVGIIGKSIFERTWKKDLKLMTFVVLAVAALFAIYFYRIYDGNMVSDNLPLTTKLGMIFENPLSAVKYVLLAVSASVVGVNFSSQYLSQVAAVALGIVIVGSYAMAVVIYIRSKMYERTYLPVMLMAYAVLIFAMTLLGRFSFGETYGMSSRYVTDTQYGLISVLWIFYFFLSQQPLKKPKFWPSVAFFLFMIIIGGQVLTYYQEWKIAPYRKQYFNKLRDIAIDPSRRSLEELKLFQYSTDLVEKGLNIIQDRELNVFNDKQ